MRALRGDEVGVENSVVAVEQDSARLDMRA